MIYFFFSYGWEECHFLLCKVIFRSTKCDANKVVNIFMTFIYHFTIEKGESFQAVLFLSLFYSNTIQNFGEKK